MYNDFMSLDVAAPEVAKIPQTPETRKWGFHVDRQPDAVNTLARFMTLGSQSIQNRFCQQTSK